MHNSARASRIYKFILDHLKYAAQLKEEILLELSRIKDSTDTVFLSENLNILRAEANQTMARIKRGIHELEVILNMQWENDAVTNFVWENIDLLRDEANMFELFLGVDDYDVDVEILIDNSKMN